MACASATPNGTYPPLLSGTSGADGYIAYGCNSPGPPVVPTPFFAGALNFAAYNVGGVDYAGDCVLNRVRCFTIGPGTIAVDTRAWSGGVRPVRLELVSAVTGTHGTVDGTSGDRLGFYVPASDGDCLWWVDLTDGPASPCGGKWGFAGFTWRAGPASAFVGDSLGAVL